jgi:predicted HD phosphohydrolase
MLADRGGDARRAGFRAARSLGRGWVPPQHLPDTGEIRRETERAMVQGSDAPAGRAGLPGDRFDRIAELVRVLGAVKRDPVKYPEGDALEHSLQVFARVSEECPWDEELLTAALVHDVGLAIDRANAVAVALCELADLVTDRTRWLVEMLPVATALHAGTLGHRARHRLEEHPDYDSLRLLESADRRGHVRSGEAPTLEEAIAMLRALDGDDGDDAADAAGDGNDDDAHRSDDDA